MGVRVKVAAIIGSAIIVAGGMVSATLVVTRRGDSDGRPPPGGVSDAERLRRHELCVEVVEQRLAGDFLAVGEQAAQNRLEAESWCSANNDEP